MQLEGFEGAETLNNIVQEMFYYLIYKREANKFPLR